MSDIITQRQLEHILTNEGIIPFDAVEDPQGYDNGKTELAITIVTQRINRLAIETLSTENRIIWITNLLKEFAEVAEGLADLSNHSLLDPYGACNAVWDEESGKWINCECGLSDLLERLSVARKQLALEKEFREGRMTTALEAKLVTDITALKSEIRDWKRRFHAFAITHICQYGKDYYGSDQILHPMHYDLLKEAGARMNAFKKAELTK